MTDQIPKLWRSLEERLKAPIIEKEHAFVPRHGDAPAALRKEESEDVLPVKRRTFLQVMGTALAMGAGCTKQPEERIIPHVKAPEDSVAGRPLFYASATVLAGIGTGVLVEQNEGRPTKIEGNPEHPASLGATDAFMQASTFDLYDPSRSKTLTHLGEIAGYNTLVGVLQKEALKFKSKRGEGLRILTGAVSSPSLLAQIDGLLKDMPLAKWHAYEAVSRPHARQGAELLFGKDLEARYDLGEADVIVSLDADLFGSFEGRLAYTRQWSMRRSPPTPSARELVPLRLYMFEPTPSITGTRADHRFPIRAADIELVARALASRLGADVAASEAPGIVPTHTLDAIARDLRKAGSRGLVVPGDFQPAAVHALAHAINVALGSVGTAVFFGEPVLGGARDPMADLASLSEDMKNGKVELLVILGANPVYDAPADLAFEERLKNVPLRVHLGLYDDETAGQCHFHVPAAHPLESWSDVRSFDGTVSLIQPLIAPLYGGKTAHDLLIALSNSPDRSSYDVVREHHAKGTDKAAAESAFRRALHDGFVEVAERPAAPPAVKSIRALASTAPASGLEIVFRPDASTFDGRFSNNGWLQELPRPMTKMTWDNAAFISPDDAKRLSLDTGAVVDLEIDGRTLRAPVWVLPGQAPGSVAVHLGYGRRRGGKIGVGLGVDAQKIRTSAAPWHRGGLSLKKTRESYEFATTQGHHSMEGRDIVRSRNVVDRDEEKHHHKHLSLYPDHEYKGYAWGMAIDLAACVGCNACMAACHAENNVPVVGKVEVQRGREMQWIRIDRYYEGPLENPRTHFQPLLCQQCEAAPCEVVCPVQATTHSDEGLNDMVYNRCVGTKYCSNNCPYKVRRYNFFGYSVDDVFGLDMKAPSLRLLHNPDVTVRSYGVMEKCTYCVQRINDARIESKKEERQIRDGEVMTACQSACPARAISFGNINDKSSEVSLRKAESRNYALLEELNTKPRTTYLDALWNPNPEIATEAEAHEHPPKKGAG